MFSRGEVIEVTIDSYAFGGRGIARVPHEDGHYVVFVDNTFPGQVVQARVEKKRKRHAEAKLIDVIKRSPIEQSGQFQEISGGPYVFVPVEEQERVKQDSTLEVFGRISNIRDIHERFDAFVSSPAHYFYRNKMEYSFSSIEHDVETGEERDDAFALGLNVVGHGGKLNH